MPYWPGYSSISPQARASYLDWLADGRKSPRCGIGYIFLYFYGLEHRFFIDSPDNGEKQTIINEVERLLEIYGDNRSVRKYLETFLDAATAATRPRPDFQPKYWKGELPISLRVGIGKIADQGQKIHADWLLYWYEAHPRFKVNKAAKRCWPEFQALFKIRFEALYPEGIPVPVPKRKMAVRYESASNEFTSSIEEHTGPVSDITRIVQPLNRAQPIINTVSEELKRFSQYLLTNPDNRQTIKANILLPQELSELFPCKGIDELQEWAQTIIDNGGYCPLEMLMNNLQAKEGKRSFTQQITEITSALYKLRTGMAPDPRFDLHRPSEDSEVVLFNLPERQTTPFSPSRDYQTLLLASVTGTLVAMSEPETAGPDLEKLADAIRHHIRLNDEELLRAQANMARLKKVPPDHALLRNMMKNQSRQTAQTLAGFAIKVAMLSSPPGPRKIATLESLFELFKLEPTAVYTAIHSQSVTDEPVTVRPVGDEEEGYAIPSKESAANTLQLDSTKIAEVMAETEEITSILDSIFKANNNGDTNQYATGQSKADNQSEDIKDFNQERNFIGLDTKHAELTKQLATQSKWNKLDYQNLAASLGLMPDGALEAINEWAFENLGDLLIEEQNGNLLVNEVRHQVSTNKEITA